MYGGHWVERRSEQKSTANINIWLERVIIRFGQNKPN